MELYQPIKIQKEGEKSSSFGVGVLMPTGAYLTGPVPDMSRVYVTAYLPKNTIFKSLTGIEHTLHVDPKKATGLKSMPFTPAIYRRSFFAIDPPKPSKVDMNITKTATGDFDIIIEETERSNFKIYVRSSEGMYIQPLSGWVWLNG